MDDLIDEEETVEQMIKRYAQNRYEIRMAFKWKLSDTAEDDYRIAKEMVIRDLHDRRERGQ
jgi:hypothetical protein